MAVVLDDGLLNFAVLHFHFTFLLFVCYLDVCKVGLEEFVGEFTIYTSCFCMGRVCVYGKSKRFKEYSGKS